MSTEPEHYLTATVTLIDKATGVTTRYDIPNVRRAVVRGEPHYYTDHFGWTRFGYEIIDAALEFRFETERDTDGHFWIQTDAAPEREPLPGTFVLNDTDATSTLLHSRTV